jgi:hypothetical protein
MRVGVAAFYHETNVFALEQNDSLDMIVREGTELYARSLSLEIFVAGIQDGFVGTGVEWSPPLGCTSGTMA